MSEITVVGSLNMDLVIKTPRVPVIGETILGSGFITVPGGKGANQAVAAARLGGHVSMIGCVGDDAFGKELLQNLKVDDINTENIETIKEASTGIAVIVIKDGNNFIIVDPGANYKLTPEMIDDLEYIVKASDIVVVQLEIPIETVGFLIKSAKKHNVKVLLNPAPAIVLSDDLLSYVDILTPNETECSIITGQSIKTIDDAKKAISFLMDKGVEQIVITMGSSGVVYNDKNNIIHKSVPDVRVVDTTAAGDSFTGALAVALSEGKDINEAVDFANIVGTLTVMKKGAQTSLPTLKDVERFIVEN